MKNYCVAPNSVDEQEVCADVTLRHAGPIGAALIEAVLPKRLW